MYSAIALFHLFFAMLVIPPFLIIKVINQYSDQKIKSN